MDSIGQRLEATLTLAAHRHKVIWSVILIAVVGLVRFDVRVAFTYHAGRVLQVSAAAGKDMTDRVVLVLVDGQPRIIRTSDRHIVTLPGQQVCVQKTRFLLRRWTSYGLQLPFYCPHLRNGFSNGLSSPAPGLSFGQP